jgi:hypothetical protein
MNPDCLRVLEALDTPPLPPELEAHRATCPECQALSEAQALFGPPPPPADTAAEPPALAAARARALEALAAQPVARSWVWDVARLFGVCAGVAGLVTGAFWATGRLNNSAPGAVVAGLAGLVLLAMGMSALVALWPARRLGPGALALGGLTAVVALGLVAGGSGVVVRDFVRGCAGCASLGLVLSAAPALVALEALRHVAFHASRALAAGLAAGAVGLLVLHLHCPEGGAAHLALAHVGPWLLVSALVLAARAQLATRVHAP